VFDAPLERFQHRHALNDVVLETRAIVGRTVTRTPILRATMRYIDVHPTWTVPPGIVHEILAEICIRVRQPLHFHHQCLTENGPVRGNTGRL
jgi:hypothetical protein